jgi:hypothetical protein
MPDKPSPPPDPTSCGCFAAVGAFLLAAFPALMLASMRVGACKDGPCHPERAVSGWAVLAGVAVGAALMGSAVRAVIARRQRGVGAAGRGAGLAAAALLGLAALAAAALFLFAMG